MPYGAGEGSDIVYLTISTGIGGGIVHGGRLLSGRGGLAGHFGQIGDPGTPLEDRVAGRWLARAAAEAGHPGDARTVFAAAEAGEGWAEVLRDQVITGASRLVCDLQLMLDPDVVVIGGGIGLSPGFLERLDRRHGSLAPELRPSLRAARLGTFGGVIGAAILAEEQRPTGRMQY